MLKTYKTIFRLDYPISFQLIDELGKLAESLHTESINKKFDKAKTDVNLQKRTLTSHIVLGQEQFRIHLSLQELDALIEHGGSEGYLVRKLPQHPACDLADTLLRQLEKRNAPKYNRFGVRLWTIIQRKEFAFEKLRDFFVGRLSPVAKSLNKSFSSIEEVGVVLEAKAEDGKKSRVIVGPYTKEENNKYFSLPHDIPEGLIVDLDMWYEKLELPGLTVSKTLADFVSDFINIIEELEHSLAEEMK